MTNRCQSLRTAFYTDEPCLDGDTERTYLDKEFILKLNIKWQDNLCSFNYNLIFVISRDCLKY
jgi:hypothetical protein